eukprot:7319083-Prymnesium_polylepis.1
MARRFLGTVWFKCSMRRSRRQRRIEPFMPATTLSRTYEYVERAVHAHDTTGHAGRRGAPSGQTG